MELRDLFLLVVVLGIAVCVLVFLADKFIRRVHSPWESAVAACLVIVGLAVWSFFDLRWRARAGDLADNGTIIIYTIAAVLIGCLASVTTGYILRRLFPGPPPPPPPKKKVRPASPPQQPGP